MTHFHTFPKGCHIVVQDMAGYASEVAGKAVNKMKNFALQRTGFTRVSGTNYLRWSWYPMVKLHLSYPVFFDESTRD